MSNFKTVSFFNTTKHTEILIALLSQEAFDSFEEKENVLVAYILSDQLSIEAIDQVLGSLPLFENIRYEINDLENKNWNEEWEKSFQAITIDKLCTIRASFHPRSQSRYDIEIEPKMAFGTGHHATTEMMISLMLKIDFTDKTVLDFGCGTGILAILAEKLGAQSIFANDIEKPAYENVAINSKLNQCTKIENHLGGIELIPKTKYDIILANVNTLVLSKNLNALKERMHQNSIILLSGILKDQLQTILDLGKQLDLEWVETREKNKWTAIQYKSKKQ